MDRKPALLFVLLQVDKISFSSETLETHGIETRNNTQCMQRSTADTVSVLLQETRQTYGHTLNNQFNLFLAGCLGPAGRVCESLGVRGQFVPYRLPEQIFRGQHLSVHQMVSEYNQGGVIYHSLFAVCDVSILLLTSQDTCNGHQLLGNDRQTLSYKPVLEVVCLL